MCGCGRNSCNGRCGWPYNRPFYNPPYSTPFNRQCEQPVPPIQKWPCPTCQPCNQVGCLKFIPTDCITAVKAYPCFGTSTGSSITPILDAICSQLTNIDGEITIINNYITQILGDVACNEWTALPLISGWENVGGNLQEAEYSDIKSCIIRLRGSVVFTFTGECQQESVATLPVGSRPLADRIYSVNLIGQGSDCTVAPGVLYISASTGLMVVVFNALVSGDYAFSLDGISFETN